MKPKKIWRPTSKRADQISDRGGLRFSIKPAVLLWSRGAWRNGWRGLGLALAFWTTACGAAELVEKPEAPVRMQKVRVAPSGRTFELEHGGAYRPLGVTYYRPGTGWAPQLWKKWDAEATRKDFAVMKQLGVNCVRVFLSYGSFYMNPGELRPEGLQKFDQLLAIAEQFGIYIHPTGPDHWEGLPNWQDVGVEDENTLSALELFWKSFASRYAGRHVIFAYDLKNEPEIAWESKTLTTKWNTWLQKKYASTLEMAAAWGEAETNGWGQVPAPSDHNRLRSRRLLDYQAFREDLADEWTSRQVRVIKAADPDALVSVGLIQWSVPSLLPGSIRYYSGFRPSRQAKFLDFMEVHFYPFADGAYEYREWGQEQANLGYLEGVVREVALPGKPVVLAEFGWYGGGKPGFDGGRHPFASDGQQARYCRRVVEVSSPFVTGWLNWGLYDQPEATDCSQFTGLLTATGKLKAWGRAFSRVADPVHLANFSSSSAATRPKLDWEACLTSTVAESEFRNAYFKAFSASAH